MKDVFRKDGLLTAEEASQMEDFDELWACDRTKSMAETVASIEGASFDVELVREIPEVGTARFAGSMFTIDDRLGLRPSQLRAALPGQV